MAGNTFKRMEKKMTVSTEMIPALQACMEEYMTPDPFNVDGKPYVICNLYFDDDADDVIRTSVSLPRRSCVSEATAYRMRTRKCFWS